MIVQRLLRISTLGLGFAACGGSSESPSTSTGSATDASTDGTGSASSTASGSAGNTSAGTESGGTGDASGEGGTAGTDTAGAGGLGDTCDGDADCESGKCYTGNPISGNVCSECTEDADCMTDGGPGTCEITVASGYAACTEGELGNMCGSDEACQEGLVCSDFIMGIASYCSGCNTDAECDGEQLCSPVYDTDALSGYRDCVEPGSVESGQGCPVDGDIGVDAACAEGLFCGVADLFGMAKLGVCGECLDRTDCGPDERCIAPAVSLTGVTPARCEAGGGTDGTSGSGGDTGTGTTG